MLAYRPADARDQQQDGGHFERTGHPVIVDERVEQREQRLEDDHLTRQRQRQTLGRRVPQAVAEPRRAENS